MLQDGCKVYMDFLRGIEWIMVIWTIFGNHLLEVGLTQNHREIMAFRAFTTVGLFYFIMWWGTCMSRASLK